MSFEINISANQMAERQREVAKNACQEWLEASLREIFTELDSAYGTSRYTIPVPTSFRDQLDSIASALEQAGYGTDTEFADRITISW